MALSATCASKSACVAFSPILRLRTSTISLLSFSAAANSSKVFNVSGAPSTRAATFSSAYFLAPLIVSSLAATVPSPINAFLALSSSVVVAAVASKVSTRASKPSVPSIRSLTLFTALSTSVLL